MKPGLTSRRKSFGNQEVINAIVQNLQRSCAAILRKERRDERSSRLRASMEPRLDDRGRGTEPRFLWSRIVAGSLGP
jgi:hypothetical protein